MLKLLSKLNTSLFTICTLLFTGDVGRVFIPLAAPVVHPVGAVDTDQHTATVGQDTSSTLPWNVQGDLSVRHDDALYTNDNGTDG